MRQRQIIYVFVLGLMCFSCISCNGDGVRTEEETGEKVVGIAEPEDSDVQTDEERGEAQSTFVDPSEFAVRRSAFAAHQAMFELTQLEFLDHQEVWEAYNGAIVENRKRRQQRRSTLIREKDRLIVERRSLKEMVITHQGRLTEIKHELAKKEAALRAIDEGAPISAEECTLRYAIDKAVQEAGQPPTSQSGDGKTITRITKKIVDELSGSADNWKRQIGLEVIFTEAGTCKLYIYSTQGFCENKDRFECQPRHSPPTITGEELALFWGWLTKEDTQLGSTVGFATRNVNIKGLKPSCYYKIHRFPPHK